MSAAGSSVSSRWASNSDVPGGVFSTHGDCFVPDPLTFALAIVSSLLLFFTVTIRLRSHLTSCGTGGSASPNADRPEFCGDVDEEHLTRLRRRKAQIGLVPDLDGIPGRQLLLPSAKSALDQVQVAAAASRKCVGNLG